MSKPRVLFSVPTRHHVEIALDELEGLQELGFACASFDYAAREGVVSKFGRLKVLIENAFELVKVARGFKPDVIYFNSRLEKLAGFRDFITIAICKILYRGPVKFVIKSHGSDIDVLNESNGFWGKLILPYLRRNVAGWLFLSTEEKQKTIETNYFSPNNIFVTKNIVRTNQFKKAADFKAKLNIPEHHSVFLFVGRVIEEKGIYDVIKAFATIAAHDTDVTLIVVGDGASLSGVKDLSKALKVDNRIYFTGFIPEQDVVSYYANCDVLVFPTYFPEGFPMALFNSVAAGMAVVTTPTRAATDYLTEYENCIWVEPKNSKSVNAAMLKLLNEPTLANTMRSKNVVKGTEFSRAVVCSELATILNTICKA
ncbi:glycosyltransferase family 4 protein [Mucilaginibacter aquatilis]|uniref:Glycosyltransferase n=1 Tax=Mucilaginibacter aquatilis TaxID=1517760 RepID=A0A6I4I9E0_9SPHI|nr:glycosyltransferase family 4 protein [Mucilaginibacter aquatilis]MVN90608.1 glycosyltransferase [Mucilaginibacter aquatilis]